MCNNLSPVTLVGCGFMGIEHAKVLNGLKAHFTVVGRGEASARAFEKETGVMPVCGGLTKYLALHSAPEKAIVAVSIEQLFNTAMELINAGTKAILLEKPGALTYEEIAELSARATEKNCHVFIAYNRRFYSSVRRAKDLIADDGGVSSFRFEFTEWSHKIAGLGKSDEVLSHWFLANSTHVVELAFYLGGRPAQIQCYTAGSLPWYPTASSFSGAGVTENGATFSYYADWQSAGRWDVEILTTQRKLILCPLEGLMEQKRGTLDVKPVFLQDDLDKQYKPGLYLQTEAFLQERHGELLTVNEHLNNCELYRKIEQL